MYSSFVRDLISHSVIGLARYATTLGTLASNNCITAVPDVHSPALLAWRGRKKFVIIYLFPKSSSVTEII
jgi:hypothetical protein